MSVFFIPYRVFAVFLIVYHISFIGRLLLLLKLISYTLYIQTKILVLYQEQSEFRYSTRYY
jgi:hypothetical protein